jgi:hypothetical protein
VLQCKIKRQMIAPPALHVITVGHCPGELAAT